MSTPVSSRCPAAPSRLLGSGHPDVLPAPRARTQVTRGARPRGVAALCVAALLALPCVPAPARAGLTLAASLGYGQQLAPELAPEDVNLMVAVGYDFLRIVRPELGLVGAWEAARHGRAADLGLELRPMVVLSAPLLPLYLRLTVAMVQPFTPDFAVAYGGSLGAALALLGLGVFGEVGILPRARSPDIAWVLEARAGVSYQF